MTENERETLTKELLRTEGSYGDLEKSLADLDAQISASPYNSRLKMLWRRQRTLLTERKTKAEEIRIKLGLPVEEEDAMLQAA